MSSLSYYAGIGGGSTLQKDLMDIVDSIQPWHAKYINDEIIRLNFLDHNHSSPFQLSHLSSESQRALKEIILDTNKENNFYEQARNLKWPRVSPGYLLNLAKQEHHASHTGSFFKMPF